jgi:uncharacterized membrane protein
VKLLMISNCICGNEESFNLLFMSRLFKNLFKEFLRKEILNLNVGGSNLIVSLLVHSRLFFAVFLYFKFTFFAFQNLIQHHHHHTKKKSKSIFTHKTQQQASKQVSIKKNSKRAFESEGILMKSFEAFCQTHSLVSSEFDSRALLPFHYK